MNKLISIVIPVYNEEENIHNAYTVVTSIMNELNGKYDYEIIFTDNHSNDRSFEILSTIAKQDSKVRIIRFSNNFGYQRSILTGYNFSKGNAAIQLDCDLQDPPELIPEFIKHWERGYNVVYGVRKSRQEKTLLNIFRKLFYRVINLVSEDFLPEDAGDFRLIDRNVLNVLKKFKSSRPYLRGAIASIGFNQIGIEYDRRKRRKGVSKFSISNLIGLGLDGISSHSVLPLRIATYFGLMVSCFTFILTCIYLVGKLFLYKTWPAGFTTIILLILSVLGIIPLMLGIIGEYIGRIVSEVTDRPSVIIEKTINSSERMN